MGIGNTENNLVLGSLESEYYSLINQVHSSLINNIMLQFNKIIIIAVLLITTSACVEKSKLATNKQASTEKFQLNILEMEFTGDCWILVKNLDENTNVITGVQAADSKIQLKLPNKHNYKILIGYPSRVNIALNDQVIQLQTRSEQPIALYLNQGTDRFLSQ